MLARERAAGLVRVDDRARGGQRVAGQVVVGHEHVDAACIRGFDARHARDPVVDGDQQVGLAGGREFDDLGREPVAVFEAVRHQVVDLRAEHPQAAHRDRTGGRAVAVVVGDDQQAPLVGDRIGEQRRGVRAAFQFGGRHEARERGLDVGRGLHAARRIQAREDGVQAVARERFGVGGRDGAGNDPGHTSGVIRTGTPARGGARTCAGRRASRAASRSWCRRTA